MRSRRNHFERFLGSVETMISSKSPSWIARSTASRGSGPPTRPSTLLVPRAQAEGSRRPSSSPPPCGWGRPG
jgi:hypothetical protein